VSNYDELVGDYTNPILKPEAAETVKKFGEMSLAGVTYPNPANQCWPEPVPFIYKSFGLQILQGNDHITMLYDADHQVRHVRMNQPHPAKLTPSWYGDSVGHYEGDTLVIDTVGERTERPYAMLDLYGTPYTKALHVVERYRLIDYDAAKDGLERDAKENQTAAGRVDPSYRGKHLQLQFTVEDEGVAEIDGTAWKVTRDTACDGRVAGRFCNVGDCDRDAVLPGRLLDPFPDRREAAPFLTLVLDCGTFAKGSEHCADVVNIHCGEIRREGFWQFGGHADFSC